jgi:Mn-dependent DtxR family transcriptional regulator
MAKPFVITVTVEEVAFGPTLRKLHELPGILKVDVDLGAGGISAGVKKHEQRAAQLLDGPTHEEKIVALLTTRGGGPMHIRDIGEAIKVRHSSVNSALHLLKKKGITVSAGTGLHRLKDAVQHTNGTALALPAPRRTPSGRIAQGSGPIFLRQALEAGSMRPGELSKALAARGMSAKGVSGVLRRSMDKGLIKRNTDGTYDLTVKGRKLEQPVAEAEHHG